MRSFQGSESSHSALGPWTQDSSSSDSEGDRITLSNKPHLVEHPAADPTVSPGVKSAVRPAVSSLGEVGEGLEHLRVVWDVPALPSRQAPPSQPKPNRSASGKPRPRLELVIPEAYVVSPGTSDDLLSGVDDVILQAEWQQRQQQKQQQKTRGGLLRSLSEAIALSFDACPYSVSSRVSTSAPTLTRSHAPSPAPPAPSPMASPAALGSLTSTDPAPASATGGSGTPTTRGTRAVHRQAPLASSVPSSCPSFAATRPVQGSAATGAPPVLRGPPGTPGASLGSPRDSWRHLWVSFRKTGPRSESQGGRGLSRGRSRGRDRGSGRGNEKMGRGEKLPEFGRWRDSSTGGQHGYTRQFERLRAEKLDPAPEDVKVF